MTVRPLQSHLQTAFYRRQQQRWRQQQYQYRLHQLQGIALCLLHPPCLIAPSRYPRRFSPNPTILRLTRTRCYHRSSIIIWSSRIISLKWSSNHSIFPLILPFSTLAGCALSSPRVFVLHKLIRVAQVLPVQEAAPMLPTGCVH